MRTKNELYREALRQVASRRQRAVTQAQERRARALAALPRLGELEAQVQSLGLRTMELAAKGAPQAERQAVAEQRRQTQEELRQLLAQNGYGPQSLEPRYTCPDCQDTGMVVVFAEIGQDVHIAGELFEDAVNEGVRQAYNEGNLRKSVVYDPLNRVNSGDNTPAIIHVRLVQGNSISLTVVPQGAGGENASSLRMFHPSATREDIIRYVVGCVQENGGKSCTPLIVGVGIGGDSEMATLLAKKALCRDLFTYNKKLLYTDMESEILDRVNRLGIGPENMGGTVTALAVNILSYPTHVSCLPVAVSLGCHATRHATEVI